VRDRPGHDLRYEIDPGHAERALDWKAAHDFERGLAATIDWYLNHPDWWQEIRHGKYQGQRLGAAS
jgi:dTDP-glucose 4,6-dehydratase